NSRYIPSPAARATMYGGARELTPIHPRDGLARHRILRYALDRPDRGADGPREGLSPLSLEDANTTCLPARSSRTPGTTQGPRPAKGRKGRHGLVTRATRPRQPRAPQERSQAAPQGPARARRRRSAERRAAARRPGVRLAELAAAQGRGRRPRAR